MMCTHGIVLLYTPRAIRVLSCAHRGLVVDEVLAHVRRFVLATGPAERLERAGVVPGPRRHCISQWSCVDTPLTAM